MHREAELATTRHKSLAHAPRTKVPGPLPLHHGESPAQDQALEPASRVRSAEYGPTPEPRLYFAAEYAAMDPCSVTRDAFGRGAATATW